MNRVRPLRFDALEARELLAKAHPATHVASRAVKPPPAPLVLDGTLAVDTKASSASQNSDGSTTTSIPIAGQIGALGKVTGVWNSTTDAYGDSTGLDTLRLRNAQGAFVVVFNTSNPTQAHPTGHGTVAYEYSQRVFNDTGIYAGASETGSIQVVDNAAKTSVVGLTLHTKGT